MTLFYLIKLKCYFKRHKLNVIDGMSKANDVVKLLPL